MNHMTSDNLRSAFGGESQAHMRYRIWGNLAKKEGKENIARLFLATSDAEQVHATLHFNALRDVAGDFPVTSMAGFGIGSLKENLEGAKGGEVFEYTQMYPAYIAVAEMQGEDEAVKAMRYAIEAEKVHAERYQAAIDAVEAGKDLEVETVKLCPVCGYIAFEDVETCPLCGCKSGLFVEY
ncbi:Rubrerythrin-2 [Peptoniphilus equinus]|uniref:Rubrerythrin-2 n=1 Tax=Peptoniphilus equinus TaxID=3016343 RepID=A0ABY7QUF1_9FIRM|nr:ferritin family protein [Peptoniphilus equinus]WBW50403.1 Rubrerythrin-2 [Peptoniphilus equinus]